MKTISQYDLNVVNASIDAEAAVFRAQLKAKGTSALDAEKLANSFTMGCASMFCHAFRDYDSFVR